MLAGGGPACRAAVVTYRLYTPSLFLPLPALLLRYVVGPENTARPDARRGQNCHDHELQVAFPW
eukprot:COSAG01_NODE_2917_length_6859_cov_3.995414_9_plen_64_part_00